MFNKNILLFHHFVPLFNLFLSILMPYKYFINSNFHVSTLYTLIIPKARKFESLKIVQLQASGTFNAPYFHYVICTRTCTNTLKTYPFVSVLVYEYDSSVLQNFKILQLFLDFPLYIFSSAFSNVFLMRCVLITLYVRLYFSHL